MESIKTITVLSVYQSKPIRDKQYDKLSKIASRYVGTIYRLADDSVIIIFGLPTAYQNDHERAIEAAGELRADSPSCRMGIVTGDISISYDVVLDYKKMELTIEAFALAHTAEPGQILINPRLYSLVENVFRCKAHKRPAGDICYEIIGISAQLKQQLESKPSWRQGRPQRSTKSNNGRQKRQELKSKAKFSRKFKQWQRKTLLYIYYFLMAIAIIASVLAILIWGC